MSQFGLFRANRHKMTKGRSVPALQACSDRRLAAPLGRDARASWMLQPSESAIRRRPSIFRQMLYFF